MGETCIFSWLYSVGCLYWFLIMDSMNDEWITNTFRYPIYCAHIAFIRLWLALGAIPIGVCLSSIHTYRLVGASACLHSSCKILFIIWLIEVLLEGI